MGEGNVFTHVCLSTGVCIQRGVCIRRADMGYYEIRSMRGRYAPYWNVFLFVLSSDYLDTLHNSDHKILLVHIVELPSSFQESRE